MILPISHGTQRAALAALYYRGWCLWPRSVIGLLGTALSSAPYRLLHLASLHLLSTHPAALRLVHILLIRAIHICNHHHASCLLLPTYCLLLFYLVKPSTPASRRRLLCHLTASTHHVTAKRTYTSSRRTSSPKPKRKHLVGSRGHGRSMLSSSPTAARRSVSQYIPPLDSLLHPRSAQQTPFLTFAPTGRAMVSKATGPEGRCLGLPCRFGAATSRERTRHPES